MFRFVVVSLSVAALLLLTLKLLLYEELNRKLRSSLGDLVLYWGVEHAADVLARQEVERGTNDFREENARSYRRVRLARLAYAGAVLGLVAALIVLW